MSNDDFQRQLRELRTEQDRVQKVFDEKIFAASRLGGGISGAEWDRHWSEIGRLIARMERCYARWEAEHPNA